MIGIQALTGLNSTQLLENSDTGDIIWQHQRTSAMHSVLTKMVRYHFKDRYQTATEALQALQLLVHLNCSRNWALMLKLAEQQPST